MKNRIENIRKRIKEHYFNHASLNHKLDKERKKRVASIIPKQHIGIDEES